MEYRTLGKTGLKVSAVGVGCWQMGGVVENRGWTDVSDDESRAIVHRAHELGVNLLDTAEGYGRGRSETVIGEALGDKRGDFVISSKVKPNTDDGDLALAKQRILEACEGSLKRLQTDYLDVYLLHAVPHEATLGAVMDTLGDLKAQGKVRWIGISTNDVEITQQLMDLGEIAVVEVGFSLMELKSQDLLDFAVEHNLGTLIRKPLASGILSGKYSHGDVNLLPEDLRYSQLNSDRGHEVLEKLRELSFLGDGEKRTMAQGALRFILDTPGVTAVIPGAKNRAQLEANAAAADVAPLTDTERQRAIELAEAIGPFRAF